MPRQRDIEERIFEVRQKLEELEARKRVAELQRKIRTKSFGRTKRGKRRLTT